MKWIKYTIETTTEGEDFVSAMLADLDITSVEIEDHVPPSQEKEGGVFAELQPDMEPDDGVGYVSFYVEEERPIEERAELLAKIRTELSLMRAYADLGSCNITESVTAQEDWADNWKQYFSSFAVDDVFIRPTWEEDSGDGEYPVVIEIDPGLSFGTGRHESTQLCIRQLRRYLQPGDRVLDIGCGSGILSVLALKLGASYVAGTDIDEDCMVSTSENMRRNRLEEAPQDFYAGNLIEDAKLQRTLQTGDYDIAVANILADIIIPMAPVIAPCLRPHALFITSGIIDFKEREVQDALTAAGFEIVEANRQGEWVNITARRA